jgi:endonuclease/exonuclease/phosphatase (EEP) superfamily protein YafD
MVGLVAIAVLGLAVATIVGVADGPRRLADVVSPFQLHMAVAAVGLAVVTTALRRFVYSAVALAVAFVNLAAAVTYEFAAPRGYAGGQRLRVMTVNTLQYVENSAAIARRILDAQPDVVLFQELMKDKAALLTRLKAEYPYQVSCAPLWYCDVAIISRVQWTQAQTGLVGPRYTKVAWAKFDRDLSGAVVASVHLRWPGISDQRAELEAALDELGVSRGGPVVLAGDFNNVAWSPVIRKVAQGSGMRPAGGLQPTWPIRTFKGGRECVVCIPQFQIDQVLVSPSIGVISTHVESDVGSDHLPVVADLELPTRVAAGQ